MEEGFDADVEGEGRLVLGEGVDPMVPEVALGGGAAHAAEEAGVIGGSGVALGKWV